MPTWTVTESNSSDSTAVTGTVAAAGNFQVVGVARAGTTASGTGQTIVGTYGTLTMNADGTFTYLLNNLDPDTNQLFEGMAAVDRFAYTSVLNGVQTTTAINFQVNGINEPGQVISNSATTLQVAIATTLGPLEQRHFTSEVGVALDGNAIGIDYFTNNGSIAVEFHTRVAVGVVAQDALGAMAWITNSGLINVVGDRGAFAVIAGGPNPIVNNGVILASATGSAEAGQFPAQAAGIQSYYHGEIITNNGTIEVFSAAGDAVGIWSRGLWAQISNSGLIYVSGGTNTPDWNLIGIQCGQSDDVLINNSGTIHVVSTTGQQTFGIVLFLDSTNPYQYGTINNSGTIVATTAISATHSYETAIHVTNSGLIQGDLDFAKNLNIVTNTATGIWRGDLQFGLNQDVLINQGTIIGNVMLADGDDLFDGRGGTCTGFVSGGAGRDLLYGSALADFLDGGSEADRLLGGGGADGLIGGAGADTFLYTTLSDSQPGAEDTISDFETGVDRIDLTQLSPTTVSIGTSGSFSIVTATVAGGTVAIRVQGAVALSDIVTTAPLGSQSGSDADDLLQAFLPGSELLGGYGNDVLYGTPGADLLNGGGGNDTMFGGASDDIYVVESDFDRTIELRDGGTDEVRSWVSYTLQAFVENLTLLGSADIDGLGNEHDNLIVGNSGNNVLTGDNGNDRIYGAGGADFLRGDTGIDTYVYQNWTDSTATFRDFIAYERGVDRIDISAVNPLSLSFEPFVNYWSGSDWTDVTIQTANGTMVVRIGGIVDHTDFISNLAPIAGGGGNDEIVGAGTNDWIDGSAGDDRLRGLGGSDTLVGGDGNDDISGGAGHDVLTGGAGADRFRFDSPLDPASNSDRIVDFGAGDLIYLDRAIFAHVGFGTLDASAFVKLEFAETSENRILYDILSGKLFYDPDGAGGAPGTLFAIVKPGTPLSAANFVGYGAPSRGDLPLGGVGDFNGDGRSDVLWRNDNGTLAEWVGRADGGLQPSLGNIAAVSADWTVVATGDFNGDHHDDLLWRNDNGAVGNWLGGDGGGFTVNNSSLVGVSTDWHVAGVGDFNGDGRADILWRNDDGTIGNWTAKVDGTFAVNTASIVGVSNDWQIVGVGNFNGDGFDDILWRSQSGATGIWLGQTNGTFTAHPSLIGVPAEWVVVGVGDFNGDACDDILWRHLNGTIGTWLGSPDGVFAINNLSVTNVSNSWHIAAIGDFDGDHRDDILWRHENGTVGTWLGREDGTLAYNAAGGLTAVSNDWHVQSADTVWL